MKNVKLPDQDYGLMYDVVSNHDDDEIFFNYDTFAIPQRIFSLDMKSWKRKLVSSSL